MTRWILRRVKHICAKANRKAKAERSCGRSAAFSPKRAAAGRQRMLRQQQGIGRKAEKTAAEGGGKAHGVCRPGRDKLSAKRKVSKGFIFVRGKVLFGCADSRFAEPRCSLQRERLVTFCIVQKVTKKHTGLRPATSIQISARFEILAEMTGHHHVTGRTGHCNLPGYRR